MISAIRNMIFNTQRCSTCTPFTTYARLKMRSIASEKDTKETDRGACIETHELTRKTYKCPDCGAEKEHEFEGDLINTRWLEDM